MLAAMLRSLGLLATVLFGITPESSGVAINNGIVGSPDVRCLEHEIQLTFVTRNPFKGRVFVKGRSDDSYCSSNYSANSLTRASVMVKLGSCGMQKVRLNGPPGVSMRITLVVSFHPIFITKVDKAFAVNCVFKPQIMALSQSLDVSMLPTTELNSEAAEARCHYSLRSDSPDGRPAKFVELGDKLYHVWQCERPSDQNVQIFVHSCEAMDSGGRQAVITVDGRGCATDPILFEGVIYDREGTRAYGTSHAYKYADRASIVFKCTIELCGQASACVIPPVCNAFGDDAQQFLPRRQQTHHIHAAPQYDEGENRTSGEVVKDIRVLDERRRTRRLSNPLRRRQSRAPKDDSVSMDVIADELIVYDIGSAPDRHGNLRMRPTSNRSRGPQPTATYTALDDYPLYPDAAPYQQHVGQANLVNPYGGQGHMVLTNSPKIEPVSKHVCIQPSMFAVMVVSTLLAFLVSTVVAVGCFGRLITRIWASNRSKGWPDGFHGQGTYKVNDREAALSHYFSSLGRR